MDGAGAVAKLEESDPTGRADIRQPAFEGDGLVDVVGDVFEKDVRRRSH